MDASLDPTDINIEHDRLCPISFVRRRYGCSDAAIKRRTEKGIFPKPDQYIGIRRHWWLSTLLRYERRVCERQISPTQFSARMG